MNTVHLYSSSEVNRDVVNGFLECSLFFLFQKNPHINIMRKLQRGYGKVPNDRTQLTEHDNSQENVFVGLYVGCLLHRG